MIMKGGPFIYDPESKKFVMRSSDEPQRKLLADLPDAPDEISLPPRQVKLPPSRKKQERIIHRIFVWFFLPEMMFLGLFLICLVLLALLTRQISSGIGEPSSLLRPVSVEFLKEGVPK